MALFDKLLDFGEIDFGDEFSSAHTSKLIGDALDLRLGVGFTTAGANQDYPNNWWQNGGHGLVMVVTEAFKPDSATHIIQLQTGTGVASDDINAGKATMFELVRGVRSDKLVDTLCFKLDYPALTDPKRYFQIEADPSANLTAGKAQIYLAPWVSTWKAFGRAANLFG